MFRQIEAGVLDDRAFQNLGETLFGFTFFSHAWTHIRGEFDPDFVEFMEHRYNLTPGEVE